jgi:hypothetical protein
MVRPPLAVLRCVALAVLTVAGFGYAIVLVAAAALVIPYPLALAGRFRLADLGRGLARRWGGAQLPDPVRLPAPAPQRRADGGTSATRRCSGRRWCRRSC